MAGMKDIAGWLRPNPYIRMRTFADLGTRSAVRGARAGLREIFKMGMEVEQHECVLVLGIRSDQGLREGA